MDGEIENSISRKNTTVSLLNQVINPEKYNSYRRLLQVKAYVDSFLRNLKSAVLDDAER